MFNVYGKGFINDKPVDLNTAIKLARGEIYLSDDDEKRCRFDLTTGCAQFKIQYGFSSVWIERVAAWALRINTWRIATGLLSKDFKRYRLTPGIPAIKQK